MDKKNVEYLVVDTTAFIKNAQLQEVAEKIITCQEVVDEIVNKRQLRRLVVLPYDLEIKTVYPENVKIVTEFAKKTGDYLSLSATDIKVIALCYQLHKEKVGIENVRNEPLIACSVTKSPPPDMNVDVTGFYSPKTNEIDELNEKFDDLNCEQSDDDDDGWITPSNVKAAKQQVNSELMEEMHSIVACMTTDFAMQNVLKQMNLNVSALDGRMIKQVRTFILRCYTCFKTTSLMTKQFCPKCGNNTLKKVAVSLDENGKMQIHINARRPLTGRGKKFSLPRIKGGKHPNNPILVADQPMADNRPSRLARTKIDPLADDYVDAGAFSPFAIRDVTSKSALLGVRPGQQVNYWMRSNPNEVRRKRK